MNNIINEAVSTMSLLLWWIVPKLIVIGAIFFGVHWGGLFTPDAALIKRLFSLFVIFSAVNFHGWYYR